MKVNFTSKKIIAIIVSVFVALIAVGVFVYAYFALQTVSGAWELTVNPEVAQATEDEIAEGDRVYYVFQKPDRYGKGEWYTCYQGGVEHYKYELMQEASVEKINLGSVDLEYSITGSRLLGNAKITLVYPAYTDETTGETNDAEEYVLEQAKRPDYEKSSYKDYQIHEKLVGQWANNERTLSYYYYLFSYTQTVDITDKGVMIIHYESEDLGLDRYMYYAYTAETSQLTFSLVTDKETKYTVGYEFDENGNLKFTDDTTTNSVFADAFFGDYTFYTPENLPEPAQASVDELYYTE